MAHVFISYSRKDTPFVDSMESALRAEGVLTWRDVHSIPGGAKWFRRIKQGLEASYAVLYVDTLNAEQSDWVEKEFLFAASLNLPIIPVKRDTRFMSLATINLNPIVCDEANFRVGVGKIIALLHTLPQTAIVTGAVAPPEPPASETPAALTPEAQVSESIDFSAEIRDYARWLLVKSQADLRDALYVSLAAQAEIRKPARADNPFGFGLDMDLDIGFTRLDLERVRGEHFDQRGEPVNDARVPVKDAPRVVLLGEPGAGKTTTLLQLAVDLARALQNDPHAPIPVFVPLRQFNGQTDFETFVRAQMYNLQDVSAALTARHEVLYLLDALNEMPRQSESGEALLPQVVAFAERQARWVLSCRVRDYQEELGGVADVSKIRLQPLDPPRIYDVIQRRFREQFAPQGIASVEDGERLWRALYGTADLLKAWDVFVACGKPDAFWGQWWPDDVKPPNAEYKWNTVGYNDWRRMQGDKRWMLPLCRNPYMTKMIADLYAIDKSLPENRGALFKKFVDKLLERDRRLAQQVGAVWLDDHHIRAGLAQIAYALGRETEMPRADAVAILAQHLPTVNHDLLLRLAMGASLLDVGANVRFTHQLLQEYFASEVLGALIDAHADPKTLWPTESWRQTNGREETLIILAGVRGDPEGVARWVAPAQPQLAVQVLTDSGVPVDMSRLDASTRQAIVDGANAKTTDSDPRSRAAAYRVLGHPDIDADKRPGVNVIIRDGVKLPDIDWVHIPAGEFTYQYGKITLDYDFYIARYLITYAHFQTFIDDSQGYHDPRWWQGLAIPEGHNATQGEQSFRYWNHPCENVSWYDAMAFSRWLSDKLSFEVRLPTEFEWEKSARANTGWRYPWGDDYLEGYANINETWGNAGQYYLKRTTAVGIYPHGDARHWGKTISDLCGNIWEWCLTDYDTPQKNAMKEDLSSDNRRVLRGGAWNRSRSISLVVYRSLNPPYSRGTGFRVVCLRSED